MLLSNRLLLLASLVSYAGLFHSCSAPTETQTVDAPVRIRWARDPEALDPLSQPNQNAADAQGLLNGALLSVNPQTQKFEPFLVDALPRVAQQGDSLTLLAYRLRSVAAWDSGQPITAADVAFTLKLLFCKGVPNEGSRMEVNFIEDVITDSADYRRFTLVCRGKSPEFVQASGNFLVLREAALDPEARLRKFSLAELRGKTTAVRRAELDALQPQLAARYQAAATGPHPESIGGSGPYVLQAYERDRSVVFARKAKWWGDQAGGSIIFQAKASKLEYLVIPDEATAALALNSGQFDVFPGVPARVFERLQKSASAQAKLAFYTSPTYEIMTAGFNTSRPALRDAGTRVALSYLFDAAQLNQASQQGKGLRTVGLISPKDKGKYNDSLALLDYSPRTVADLLGKAGWRRNSTGWERRLGQGQPQRLELRVRYRAGETNYELVALQFASAANSLGIVVNLIPTESGTLRPLLQKGEYDVYVQSIKGNPFLFNFLPILGTQAIGQANFTRFGTPATDQLLEQVAATETTAERELMLRRFQAMMRREMPLVPLYFVANRVIARKSVAGLNVNSLKPGYVATTVYHVAAQ